MKSYIQFAKKMLFSACFFLLPVLSFSQRIDYMDEARRAVQEHKIGEAISFYEQAVKKTKPYQPDLLGEYAYALALGGVHNAALMELDRARLYYTNELNTSEMNYYAFLVFQLMGYDDLAGEFKKLTKRHPPSWIEDNMSDKLLSEYRQIPHINHDSVQLAFLRANWLAANNMLLQSVALFRELIRNYPEGFVLYAGYSVVLEKLGFLDLSISAMDTCMKYIPTDPEFAETLTAFKERQENLHKTSENNIKRRNFYTRHKIQGLMLYAGGLATPNSGSLDTRFGIYTKRNFSFSLDISLTFAEESAGFNFGTSVYKTWIGRRSDVFIGAGLGLSTGMDSPASFYINNAFGIRIKPIATDISFNLMQQMGKGLEIGYDIAIGITIGHSIYFGHRRK
ncbi:MAG: hypothetical protein LBI60_03470 [Bacteroidales bacterium]|jgi:tetratricopeptide (TPR) repeat protein|nr:hypothetical protein [Bacteroidales bacterium]